MTTDRRVEEVLRRWLEEQPEAAPAELLDSVFADLVRLPQRGRWRRLVSRSLRLGLGSRTSMSLAAAAVIVAVVAGITLIPGLAAQGPSAQVGRPGPSVLPNRPSEASPSFPVFSPTAAATSGVTGASTVIFTAASSAPPGAIVIRSNGFAYVPSSVTAKAGTVSFYFINIQDIVGPPTGRAHNIAIGTSVGTVLVQSRPIQASEAEIFTVANLPAGTYSFFSTIVGEDPYYDYQLGMVGTLIVTP